MSKQMQEIFETLLCEESEVSGMDAPNLQLSPCVLDDGAVIYSNDMIQACWWAFRMAWQASRDAQPTGYTAVDVATAAADGRSSLIEILLEQMALKQYPDDRLDAECSAYNSALEDVRQMLRSVKS